MRFLNGFTGTAGKAGRMRRRAGLRTWMRALGDAGLSPESEAWVTEIERDLRRAEPRIRAELSQRRARLPAAAPAGHAGQGGVNDVADEVLVQRRVAVQ